MEFFAEEGNGGFINDEEHDGERSRRRKKGKRFTRRKKRTPRRRWNPGMRLMTTQKNCRRRRLKWRKRRQALEMKYSGVFKRRRIKTIRRSGTNSGLLHFLVPSPSTIACHSVSSSIIQYRHLSSSTVIHHLVSVLYYCRPLPYLFSSTIWYSISRTRW